MDGDHLINTPVLGGNYVITHKLGEGGMGAVYAAQHVSLNKKIVIRVLLPQFNQHAEIVQRFQNEALAASELEHPDIIDIIDVGMLGESHYIAMEFLEGTDLDGYLRQRERLAPGEVLEIFVQVCSALQMAHERQIVHRDLKPANIFINGIHNGVPRVKLLDFGIAKLGDPKLAGQIKTRTHQVMGTPMYMSVEQARGYPVDHRADIYSLGAIAYQLLTGQLPYTGNSLSDIVGKQLGGPHPEPIANIPDSWNEAILGALSDEVEQRPQSARAFCKHLWNASPAFTALAARVDLAFVNRAGAEDSTRRAGQFGDAVSSTAPQTTTLGAAAGAGTSAPPPTPGKWRWAVAGLLVVGLGVGGSLLALRNADDGDSNRTAGHETQTKPQRVDFDPTKPDVDKQPPATGKKTEHKPIKSFDPSKPSVDAKPDLTTVTIVVKPARAIVHIDGQVVTERPIKLKKDVGQKLVVKATLRGHDARDETIVVPNKPAHRVELTLARTKHRRGRTATRKTVRAARRQTPKKPPKPKPAPINFDPTKPEIR